jgi:hypothetical protein
MVGLVKTRQGSVSDGRRHETGAQEPDRLAVGTRIPSFFSKRLATGPKPSREPISPRLSEDTPLRLARAKQKKPAACEPQFNQFPAICGLPTMVAGVQQNRGSFK